MTETLNALSSGEKECGVKTTKNETSLFFFKCFPPLVFAKNCPDRKDLFLSQNEPKFKTNIGISRKF